MYFTEAKVKRHRRYMISSFDNIKLFHKTRLTMVILHWRKLKRSFNGTLSASPMLPCSNCTRTCIYIYIYGGEKHSRVLLSRKCCQNEPQMIEDDKIYICIRIQNTYQRFFCSLLYSYDRISKNIIFHKKSQYLLLLCWNNKS